MTRICPQCAQENYYQAAFCSRCGFMFSGIDSDVPLNDDAPTPLPATPADANPGYVAPINLPQAGAPQSYEPVQPTPPTGAATYAPQTPPTGAATYAPQTPPTGETPLHTPQPGDPAYGQPGVPGYGYGYGGLQTSDPYRAPGGVYQQPSPVQPGTQPPAGQQYFQPVGQRSTGQGLPVQRAFAGKGTPLTHTSWLLDGKQVAPTDLHLAIMEKVQRRYLNEVKVSQERLFERDTVLEERDYIRIERAATNVFIYVAPFGSDLYISRTTTVQPTLSPVRIGVLSALFLLMLIGFIVSATDAASAVISLFSALLLIFFVVVALHTLVLWFTEKDFLAYLRPNVLNDFRIDDGAILEHIADRGIREAAEGLNLDASTLAVPPRNYPARQPLHLL